MIVPLNFVEFEFLSMPAEEETVDNSISVQPNRLFTRVLMDKTPRKLNHKEGTTMHHKLFNDFLDSLQGGSMGILNRAFDQKNGQDQYKRLVDTLWFISGRQNRIINLRSEFITETIPERYVYFRKDCVREFFY